MGNCACDIGVDQLNPLTPLSVVFVELAAACNNACRGCGNVFAGDPARPALNASAWATVVERLAPYAPALRITGGEPTLHPQFASIIHEVDSSGLPYTVFSNARWPDAQAILTLLRQLVHLECLLISLHGASAVSHDAFTGVPGSFAETTANLRRAAAAGLRVTTSTVITRHNHAEIAQIVALSQALGAERAVFNRYIGNPLPEIEASPAELRSAVAALELLRGCQAGSVGYGTPVPHCFTPNGSYGCMAGFAHVTVDPWGYVRPCAHVPLLAGNILDGPPLSDLLAMPVMQNWRSNFLDQCTGCSHRNVCFGACQAMAYIRKTPRDALLPPCDNQPSAPRVPKR